MCQRCTCTLVTAVQHNSTVTRGMAGRYANAKAAAIDQGISVHMVIVGIARGNPSLMTIFKQHNSMLALPT